MSEPGAATGSGRIVFVDFDHTLFGSNSTERFIAACRPMAPVAALDIMIRRCVPWGRLRLRHAFRGRDYACVVAIVLLMPWNLWLWRRRAPGLFAAYRSSEVEAMLTDLPGERVILSFGMAFILRALVRGSEWERVPIVATRFRSELGFFRLGKRDLAIAARGEVAVRASTLLTDSEDDCDLLDACADGRLIVPQGDTFRARERLYWPLRYAAVVKYGFSFTIDQWLLVDAAVYLLATLQGGATLAPLLVIAPLLALSFMAVYEIGYFENDMEAAAREAKPVLGREVDRFRGYPIRVNAWIWGVALGAVAIALAWWTLGIEPFAACLWWAGALVVSRLLFLGYNRQPARARIYTYPLLQIVKYGAPLVILPATVAGAALVVVQIALMWGNYIVYRLGGDNFAIPKEYVRTVLFAVGVGLLATTGALEGVAEEACVIATAVWSAARLARRPLVDLVKRRRD